jgi:IclR family transcriptional regulator, pca regulon regulatory protein
MTKTRTTTASGSPGASKREKRAGAASVAAAAGAKNLPRPGVTAESADGDPNFMTSLSRGLAVIRAFSQHRKKLSIAQISHHTGIPRAAVRRCLHTLARLGYVDFDQRDFALSPKILTLGHAYLSSTPLSASAQPLLDRVAAEVHESCSITILEEDEILYVARSAATSRIMSVDLAIGSRLPAYCTSMGRVLLAHLPAPELAAYFARVELRPYTQFTLTSRERLGKVLDGVRSDGYSIVDQELEIGLRSIAVPVTDASGRAVAAMNIGAQASRASARHMEQQFLPALRDAARDLGLLLG